MSDSIKSSTPGESQTAARRVLPPIPTGDRPLTGDTAEAAGRPDRWNDVVANYPNRPGPSTPANQSCDCNTACPGSAVDLAFDFSRRRLHVVVYHADQLEAVAILSGKEGIDYLALELDHLEERWALFGAPLTAMPSDGKEAGIIRLSSWVNPENKYFMPADARVRFRDGCDYRHACGGFITVHSDRLGSGRLQVGVYHDGRPEGTIMLAGDHGGFLLHDLLKDLASSYGSHDGGLAPTQPIYDAFLPGGPFAVAAALPDGEEGGAR